MMARAPGGLDFYVGSHWLQGAVICVLVFVIAGGLLAALDAARDKAERLAVDLTVRHMRSGMQWAMADAMARQRDREIPSWAGTNPVRWLGAEPAGYRGECSPGERAELPARSWCFDRERHEMAYRPAKPEQLRRTGSAPCDDLAWRVVRVTAGPDGKGVGGLRLEPVGGCEWIVDR